MKRPAEDAAEEPAQKKPAVCTDAKSGQAEGPYFVHDNGGRPFKVEVTRTNSSKANVQVFKILNQSESEDGEDGEDGEDQEDAEQKESKEGVEGVEGVRVVTAGDLAKELGVDKLFLKMADGEGEEEEDGEEDEEDQDMPNYEEQASVTLSVERVFVGQCPKHGARFDGNSMLLHLEGLKYVFVGEQVFSFTAKAPITKYVSPVGNSDVPYPWAMDEQGLRYLMISSVILTSKLFENSDTDPYDLFFDRSLITADIGFVPPKQPLSQFQGITEFWIGEEQYTLRYEPHPEADFDRLSGMGELFVVKSDGKIKLSKADYLKLMQDFAEEMGFQALDTQTLVERQI